MRSQSIRELGVVQPEKPTKQDINCNTLTDINSDYLEYEIPKYPRLINLFRNLSFLDDPG